MGRYGKAFQVARYRLHEVGYRKVGVVPRGVLYHHRSRGFFLLNVITLLEV